MEQEKMLQLLIDAANELLYIIRNNDKLKHTGDISRIINEFFNQI